MRLLVADTADDDASRAVRFYDSQPDRHGAAFRAEYLAAIDRIAAAPRQFPRVEDAPDEHEVRELYIARFKQRVLFNIVGEEVRVFAVVHANATSRRWLPQLPTDATE